MAKSIEPEVKDWFAQALSQHKTKYCIEQGTLNIEIEKCPQSRTVQEWRKRVWQTGFSANGKKPDYAEKYTCHGGS